MLERSVWQYIALGTCVRFLLDAKPGWRIHGDAWILTNIRGFISELERFELPVTRRAARPLETAGADLEKTEDGARLSDSQATNLRNLVRSVRDTLRAEALGSFAFIVSDKRLSATKLLNECSALFAKGIFARLPEIASYDFNEAGRCIAFTRSTAGAFHILRGTEAVLRAYYEGYIKQKRLGRKQRVWGAMAKALAAKKTSPPAALLNSLEHIRENFRNPTQHPEKIYDIDEVQDLFGVCVDVINKMVVDAKYPL